jgi:hypothetical protein
MNLPHAHSRVSARKPPETRVADDFDEVPPAERASLIAFSFETEHRIGPGVNATIEKSRRNVCFSSWPAGKVGIFIGTTLPLSISKPLKSQNGPLLSLMRVTRNR